MWPDVGLDPGRGEEEEVFRAEVGLEGLCLAIEVRRELDDRAGLGSGAEDMKLFATGVGFFSCSPATQLSSEKREESTASSVDLFLTGKDGW